MANIETIKLLGDGYAYIIFIDDYEFNPVPIATLFSLDSANEAVSKFKEINNIFEDLLPFSKGIRKGKFSKKEIRECMEIISNKGLLDIYNKVILKSYFELDFIEKAGTWLDFTIEKVKIL